MPEIIFRIVEESLGDAIMIGLFDAGLQNSKVCFPVAKGIDVLSKIPAHSVTGIVHFLPFAVGIVDEMAEIFGPEEKPFLYFPFPLEFQVRPDRLCRLEARRSLADPPADEWEVQPIGDGLQ